MRFRQHHLGRALAAVGLMTGSFAFATAGPVAADGAEPFGERYEETLYGAFATSGDTSVPSTLALSVPLIDKPTPTPPPSVRPEPASPAPGPHGNGGSTAGTGGNGERLWLLGALALALAATGLVAKAAMRGRGD
jgi:hypothetical protein